MPPMTELLRLQEVSCNDLANAPMAHINAVICQGELIGVVAPDDPMKHTFLKLLTCQLQPQGGRVLSCRDTTRPFFGYIVRGEGLFAQMTVTENLLWMGSTRQRVILSLRKANRRAAELLARYQLDIPPHAPVSQLTLAQRYQLELVKAMEIHRAHVLVIDNLHTIADEAGQQSLLQMTQRFRGAGGAVVLSSIVRSPILQSATRTYLLQNGQPVRTLFEGAQDVYRAHTDRLLSGYVQHMVGSILASKQHTGQVHRFRLQVQLAEKAQDFEVQSGEILGLYARQGWSDRQIDQFLKSGAVRLSCDGQPVAAGTLAELIGFGIGYFPRQLEQVVFERLDFRENVEILAYPKLCRWPGIINRKLERYFMQNCVCADETTRSLAELYQCKRHVLLQTVINRFAQRGWKLMLLHIPAFVGDTQEYQLLQNFMTDLRNKGTALVILSNDQIGLQKFCENVQRLP